MAGLLWYKDLNFMVAGAWNQFAINELVEVTYVDEVYKPAEFSCSIQNISAGGGVAQTSVAHDGGDGSTTDGELIVTKISHGLSTTDRVSVSDETTGEVITRIYEVEKIDADTFYLRHFLINPWSNEKNMGSEVNRISGNGSSGTLTYVPTGKYSMESASVANPDLTMGQEIIYWQLPEKFKRTSFSHNGASPLIVAHTGHGYENGKILQITNENSGAIVDGEYQVSNKDTDTYRLKHIKSGEELNGVGSLAGTFETYVTDSNVGYPLFYGTIVDLEEAWSPAYGKVIKLRAKDNLQFLNNTTVKKIQKSFRTTGEVIGGVNSGEGKDYHMGASLKAPVYLDGTKLDGSSQVETKVSDALANIVSDFNEGAAPVYTDNTNGSQDFFVEKFEDSGFVMSDEELASGQFKRDLSDVGHKVLRAMKDMAMSDRHVTASGSGNDQAWDISGASQQCIVTHSGHGLEAGQEIAVNDSTTHSSGFRVPNGYYTVQVPSSSTFVLLSLDGDEITNSAAANGTLDWEGAEDGNFGYDFFIDSGIYGQPNEYGYQVAGAGIESSTDLDQSFPPRPHLNYFKRGYRQFRPDATGLTVVSPVIGDTAEDGQTRIMFPNTQWKIGDDEIYSDVDLQITGTAGGDSNVSDLGHNLQLIRIKKIQCCNNVDAFTDRNQRLNHAGRWNGQFHWNRHDSFTAKDIGDSIEKHETLVGINDQAMFCKSGDTLTDPGFSDDNSVYWQTTAIGAGGGTGDGWGEDTGYGLTSSLTVSYGSSHDRDVLRRVISGDGASPDSGMGGIGAVNNDTTAPVSYLAGGAWRVSGYAGPSTVPIIGRSLLKGPGDASTVHRHEVKDADGNITKHAGSHYTSGVVDCDLIKSIKNCEEEGLYEVNDWPALAIDHANASTFEGDAGGGASGDIIISHNNNTAGHGFVTGAIIRITGGDLHDSSNYWNNYKRVVVEDSQADWALNALTGRNTATKFYITNLPNEAYEGIAGTAPTTSTALPKIAYTSGSTITYKRVFNVFDGVCRVQYQSGNTRNEKPNNDCYVLISDRARWDKPHMSLEVHAVADEDRKSSTTTLQGLTTGKATMPDSYNYSATRVGDSVGLAGGLGRKFEGVAQYTAMPVRFRTGDRLSETRFLMRDEGLTTNKHLFKNTQAVITHSLMEDKKRAKTQPLTYAAGNDQNEVRRTAAALLTRTAKDLIRGKVQILQYPFIKLTGQIRAGFYTSTSFTPTQAVPTYGGRAGMLVTKTDTEDGDYVAGVLAEKINAAGLITGTLSTGSWAEDDWYRMYIHMRAGHSVRVSDPLSSVSAQSIITKLTFKESPNQTSTTLEVIGYQDLPGGSAVKPLGTVNKAVVENKGDLDGPITLGKARLNEITFSSGDSS